MLVRPVHAHIFRLLYTNASSLQPNADFGHANLTIMHEYEFVALYTISRTVCSVPAASHSNRQSAEP